MAQNHNLVDRHVGARLKLRRSLLGMSQERLGELLGVSFQQIQKYERGANRIGSSRLYELGLILDAPVSFFFEDLPGATEASAGLAENQSPFAAGPDKLSAEDLRSIERREALELVRAFAKIRDEAVRRRLLELAKSLRDAPSAGDAVRARST